MDDNAVDHDTVPPANRGLLAAAGVLLAIPIIALLWVSSYNKVEPRLGGFPFFIWYQFLWVFLCSAMTYSAYLLVLRARPHRPMRDPDERSDRYDRYDRADATRRADVTDRTDRADVSDRTDRADVTDRTDRTDEEGPR